MKLAQVLTIDAWDKNEKAIEATRHLTGNERVSLLEELRREMAKVLNREYPSRLRRVLEIAQRERG